MLSGTMNSTGGNWGADGINSNEFNSALPQILSRSETSLLSALAKLGAGDVVECYILTRSAKLETFGTYDTHNSHPAKLGFGLEVRKSAIAFFYRPKGSQAATSSQASSTAPDSTKKQLQLTLEYGPSRAGAFLDYDTVPIVVQPDTDEKYVSWSNDGTPASIFLSILSLHIY